MDERFWKVESRNQAIVITCKGHDTEGTVYMAVEQFNQLAERLSKFVIIADLEKMVSYEAPSRVAWQEAFFARRTKIGGLILVACPSAFIRVGATAVGLFARINVRFVNSWTELPEYGVGKAG